MNTYRFELPDVIAQLVHFAHDNLFTGDEAKRPLLSDEVENTVAFQVACMLAQHTELGEQGVETETAATLLAVKYYVPYEARLQLARAAVAEFGKD